MASKYFYILNQKDSMYTGAFSYDTDWVGQTRGLARELKRELLLVGKVRKIHKFERVPPYKYLGVVS